jgi:hypothetical protein
VGAGLGAGFLGGQAASCGGGLPPEPGG